LWETSPVDALRNAERIVVGTVIFLIPVLIWRVALDPFDLMKGSVLWLLGASLCAIRGIRFAGEKRWVYEPMLALPVYVMVLSASIVSALSIAPWTSLFGQYQRYTGLLTIASLGLFALVLSDQGRKAAERFIWLLVAAGVVVVGYGFVQEYGKDPLEWTATSFGKLVFSTLGNPNTASAWLSVFIPLLLALTLSKVSSPYLAFVPLAALSAGSIALLPAFYSFQGQVAVVVALPVCVLIARAHKVGFFGWLGALGVGLTALIAPQLDYSTGLLLIVLVIIGLGFFVYRLDFGRERPSKGPALSLKKRTIFLGSLGGVFGGAALLVLGWSRITSGLRGGFLERGDFYRAGWRVFREYPLFGSGLETFGFTFTRFRPASHAINLESSRTSSAHNLFLGMFSNGGILLGCAYVALVVGVGVACVKLLRKTGCRDACDLGLVGSWLGFQVISLVSVEHVGLFTMHFTLIGLIFARMNERPATDSRSKSKSASRRRQKHPSFGLLPWVVAGVTLVGFVVASIQVTRPLRAAMDSYSGLQAYYSTGDLATAARKVERASDLAPWEPIYSLQLAEIKVESGDIAGAAPYAIEAARTSRYQGSIIASAASVVFDSGDTEGALDMMRKAVANDPYAPSLKKNLAILSVLAAERFKNAGDITTARSLLEDGLTLDPTIEAEGLDALKDAVGL
jgi:O-antigen ligase